MPNYKLEIFLLSFLLFMSCHSSKTNGHVTDSDVLSKAEELLNSNEILISSNSTKDYFLCSANKKSGNSMKSQIKYVVLDKSLNIKYPVTTLTEGSVEWLDDIHIKTVQKMGIAQAGASNILSFSINITNGESNKL